MDIEEQQRAFLKKVTQRFCRIKLPDHAKPEPVYFYRDLGKLDELVSHIIGNARAYTDVMNVLHPEEEGAEPGHLTWQGERLYAFGVVGQYARLPYDLLPHEAKKTQPRDAQKHAFRCALFLTQTGQVLGWTRDTIFYTDPDLLPLGFLSDILEKVTGQE